MTKKLYAACDDMHPGSYTIFHTLDKAVEYADGNADYVEEWTLREKESISTVRVVWERE